MGLFDLTGKVAPMAVSGSVIHRIAEEGYRIVLGGGYAETI